MAEEHRTRLGEMEAIIAVTQQRMERERTDAEKGMRATFDANEADQEQAIVARRVLASTQVRALWLHPGFCCGTSGRGIELLTTRSSTHRRSGKSVKQRSLK